MRKIVEAVVGAGKQRQGEDVGVDFVEHVLATATAPPSDAAAPPRIRR